MSVRSTAIFLICGLLNACNDQLELEPFQSISEDVALSTDATVKAVLVGAYDELGNGDLFGGNNLRDAELLANVDELSWEGTFNSPGEIVERIITTGNNDVQETWLESYQTINIVNNVLSALDVVNEEDQNRVEGESRFIRAIVYFDLVRFFALPYQSTGGNGQLGVPLVTEPTRGISEQSRVTRATVEEVYSLILEDLDLATQLLPENNDIFATIYSASALRSRVYLQMGRYADALEDADQVISNGNFVLVSDYADVFMNSSNTSEDIFAIQVTTQDGVNNLNTFYSVPAFGGRDGDIVILPPHLALYEENDDRLALFFEQGGRTFTGKFNDQFANVGIIRLAEMYLIRAEANARLGTEVGATPAEDINRLRNRAGLDDLAANEVDVAFILEERRRELAFEGFRIHDIKRLQSSVGTFAYDANELVFPIPAREIVANPNIEQNPGYN